MNIAIITAGGRGTRMGETNVPKQFLEVGQQPLIVHTVNHFQNNKNIDAIIVVCVSGFIDYIKNLKDDYHLSKIVAIVPGGATGQESIFNGIQKAYELYRDDENAIVLIHDSVRPLIDSAIIDANIQNVQQNGTSVTVNSISETVLQCADGVVQRVIERSSCFSGRAPQAFYLRDLYQCHLLAKKEGKLSFVDSSSLMSHYGYKLFTVEGPIENIKVTTPLDFDLVQGILKKKKKKKNQG